MGASVLMESRQLVQTVLLITRPYAAVATKASFFRATFAARMNAYAITGLPQRKKTVLGIEVLSVQAATMDTNRSQLAA
jgi:hypothetical protein